MSINISSIIKTLENEPKYRITQAIKAVYSQSVESWSEVSVFSKGLRERLNKECPLIISARLAGSPKSRTLKASFDFEGDLVEAVLMRHKNWNTVCVSSQAGCALACDFCLTGVYGFKRNLTADEIITQVLYFARLLKKEKERVTSVVFMGMGEPFLNYDEVLKAIRKLNDINLFNIGARHISISTVGIVSGIKRLAKERLQVNLSVSIHAPDDELRSRIMPINKKYPLNKVLSAVREYIKLSRRRVMIEYVLLKDINDSPTQATALATLLKAELTDLFYINLINYNSAGHYKASDPEAVNLFKQTLEKAGLTVVERYRFGRDIKAACGQLAGEGKTSSRR